MRAFELILGRNGFAGSNGYLVCASCIYLAAKVEECPLHIRSITTELRALCNWTLESSAIAEFEFRLLQELDFSLLVYHPYSFLPDYLKSMGQESLLSLAWQVLNDLYKTRTPLLCSPHLMALAAIYFACQIHGTLTNEVLQWFSNRGTDADLHEVGFLQWLIRRVGIHHPRLA